MIRPRLASIDNTFSDRLPAYSQGLFEAKSLSGLTFAQIGEALGRNEVAVAAIFYGQATASPEDALALRSLLGLPEATYQALLATFPDRGLAAGPMPPREPLIYRLYEVVQNYGYALKAVLNEKLGDGIMSAIAFSAKVDKEVDEAGATWAVITLRGKWLPYSQF